MAAPKQHWSKGPNSDEVRAKLRAALIGKAKPDDVRQKISGTLKGNIPWNKGRTMSSEELEKMSKAHMGQKAWNKGTKGVVKSSRKGKRYPHLQGANSPSWKGGITSESKLERTRFRATMQYKIFSRDDYTCVVCDQHGGYLQIDHIKSWADYPELRFEESNCRTVCMACHYYITFKRKLPLGVIWGHNLSKRVTS